MDHRLEAKLGFDKVRADISARCCTEYASDRVGTEEFSTIPEEIHRRHLLTDEMRLILMFEDGFPTSGYIDAIPFLEPIGKNASIDLLSLGKLRTLLDTLRKALHFFHTVKEGIYPNLQHMAAGIGAPAEVMQRIDSILDRHGEIKDTASDELYKIRRSIILVCLIGLDPANVLCVRTYKILHLLLELRDHGPEYDQLYFVIGKLIDSFHQIQRLPLKTIDLTACYDQEIVVCNTVLFSDFSPNLSFESFLDHIIIGPHDQKLNFIFRQAIHVVMATFDTEILCQVDDFYV